MTMPAKKRPVSSVLDLAAKDAGDHKDVSDDDLPLSRLGLSADEVAARGKDAQFLNDEPSLSKSPRNNVVSSDDHASFRQTQKNEQRSKTSSSSSS